MGRLRLAYRRKAMGNKECIGSCKYITRFLIMEKEGFG